MSQQGLAASRELAGQYAEVVAALTAEAWAAPSRCAGWRVQDLVAHTGSNFRVLVEPPAPPAEPPPAMTAEQAQELLVEQRRGWSTGQVREEFETYRGPALDALAAMQEAPLAGQPLTLGDLGTYPVADLADAFAFDLYCHLRVDMLAPDGPVEHPLPAAPDGQLGPAVGWMLTGLPQMCPGVAGQLTRPVGLRLTGPGGRQWTLRQESGAVTVEPGLTGTAAVVTSSAHAFVLWGTRRLDWRDCTTVEGDRALAERVLDAVNIV